MKGEILENREAFIIPQKTEGVKINIMQIFFGSIEKKLFHIYNMVSELEENMDKGINGKEKLFLKDLYMYRKVQNKPYKDRVIYKSKKFRKIIGFLGSIKEKRREDYDKVLTKLSFILEQSGISLTETEYQQINDKYYLYIIDLIERIKNPQEKSYAYMIKNVILVVNWLKSDRDIQGNLGYDIDMIQKYLFFSNVEVCNFCKQIAESQIIGKTLKENKGILAKSSG